MVLFPERLASGPGTKFFIEPTQSVVRGGRVTGVQWDPDNRGDDSVAFGLDATASGNLSMALGSSSTAAHAGSFVWADGAVPQASTAEDEVTFGSTGGLRVYADGETAIPAYVGGQIYLDAAETVMTGKLTVTGIIDPTGLVLVGQASTPGGIPPAAYGTYWATDAAGSLPRFTDDSGNVVNLGVASYTHGAFQTSQGLVLPSILALDYAPTNSFVYGSQSMDDTGDPADDARFLFDRDAAAFRAGSAAGTQWDNRGAYSVGFGSNTQAPGDASLAAGSGCVASGEASVALGLGADAAAASTFVFSATATRTATSANEVTLGCEGGCQIVTNGASVPVYAPPQIYFDATLTVATGSGTVTGVTETAGLSLTPATVGPAAVGALWARDTTPTTPMFTDMGANEYPIVSPFYRTSPNTTQIRLNPSLATYDEAGTSFLFGSQTMDDSGDPDEDARLFYDANTFSFRSGIATGTQWDTRGVGSTAIGIDCAATGYASVALGNGSSATDDHSFVWSDATPRASHGDSSVTVGATKLTVPGAIIQEDWALVQVAGVAPAAPSAGTGKWWSHDYGSGQFLPAFIDSTGAQHIMGRNAFLNTSVGQTTLSDGTAPGFLATNSFVFGSQTLDEGPFGSEARMLLDCAIGVTNAAFRAGTADGAQWDATNRGSGSVALGANGVASGAHSMALGLGSEATHDHSLVWSDATARVSTADDQVTLGATGGMVISTNPAGSLGVTIGAGLSAWAVVSDRNAKDNLRSVVGVLERLEKLGVYEYNYKGHDPAVVCRGPMAQDWHDLFPTAKDKLRLDTIDLDGVTIAAIQELAELVDDLERQLRLV